MIRLSSRAAITAALASIGALAVPAVAAAAPTATVTGNVLTVTADDTPDAIALATEGANLAVKVNGVAVAQTPAPLPANDTAEIVVNAGAGNDIVDASALVAANYKTLTVNGGAGDDAVTGGFDIDTLNGDGGNDRLTGFRGTDAAFGGDGDDVMVWNNGDGTDTNQGAAGFDRTEVNGSPAAGDVFKLAPAGAATKFERTNLVAFSVTIDNATTEAIEVNGGVGDDEFVVSPGVPLLVAADGGPGNDTLTGSDENNSLFGGSGGDTITGGGGNDLLDGEEGDDRLFARDGKGDLVRGGTGADSAQTDSAYVDPTNGIEALDATPLPILQGNALPKLGKAKVVRSRGKLFGRVTVSCASAATSGCKAALTLETAKAVKVGSVRARLVLGSKRLNLRRGQRATVSIRLTRGQAALARRGKLVARVR